MLTGVSKTAILTLRSRVDEHQRSKSVLRDPVAAHWFEQLQWPAELDTWYKGMVPSFLAFRASEIDRLLKRRFESLQGATVVELGVGLSTRRYRLLDSYERWLELDLPEVVSQREKLGVPVEDMMAMSVTDDWMAQVDVDPDRLVILAEGLLYYLPRAAVEACFVSWRRSFPDAHIICDMVSQRDFPALLKRSSAVGTPVQWALRNGFSQGFEEFGIDIIEDWEPQRLMKENIDLYLSRFGPLATLTGRITSKVPAMYEKRSGILAGRLRPLAQ